MSKLYKQNIIDNAFKLFSEKGYDNVTIREIEKETNISSAIFSMYFKTKKDILDEAIKEDAKNSSEASLELFFNENKHFEDYLKAMEENLFNKGHNSKYYDYYNMIGNESLHFQLGLEKAKYMLPYVKNTIIRIKEESNINLEEVDVLSEFIIFGWIGLWISIINAPREVIRKKAYDFLSYVYKLLELEKGESLSN